MKNLNLLKQIKTCMEAVLKRSLKDVFPDTRLQEDLEMESLQLVELQVELEMMFHITFDPLEDDFLEIFRTVRSICEAVAKKLEE